MNSTDEICSMDAISLVQGMKSKSLSPVEVASAFIQQTERLEPLLHSFSALAFESALCQARTVESELISGRDPGPLAGLPIGIKDCLYVKGLPTTHGSRVFKDFVPEENDPSVDRIQDAGAVIIGKTNQPEFAYSSVGHNPLFPTTTNPWNVELTPGGSSSGSGSAVAAGQVPVAMGTDRAGSIRIPAAHCGIFGFKPSLGRIPVGLRTDIMAQAGPMARTVADAALLMNVVAGFDARDRYSLPDAGTDWLAAVEQDIRGLRIGYSADFGYAPVDPQVRALVENAVRVFERDLGCSVEEFTPGWQDPWDDFLTLCVSGLNLVQMRAMVEEHGKNISPHVIDAVRYPWRADDFTNANAVKLEIWRRMAALTRQFDLLVTPTVAVPPFPLLMQGPEQIDGQSVRPMEWIPFTFPVNMCGMPAASVPAGWTEKNLPVGLQIIGPRLGDKQVLAAAAAFERAAPWRHRWPDLARSDQGGRA
ncbi:MAG: amidase [Pigmentiphaga sp.]